MTAEMKDLVILAADGDIKAAVTGLLNRPQALAIRTVSFDVLVHPYHDAACYSKAAEFLRLQQHSYRHALVVFDRDGCGHEQRTAMEIETKVTQDLQRSGWDERTAAVVLDPELEVWVFADSPDVPTALGWDATQPQMRAWLEQRRLWPGGHPKPPDPKLAMETALREVRKPRSASIYAELARRVSIKRCQDPALRRLMRILQQWFP